MVKQALIGATLRARYCYIKASTYGVAFFAVPQRGGEIKLGWEILRPTYAAR